MAVLKRFVRALPLLCATAFPLLTQTNPSSFVNFEGALTSPIRLSPDGTRLFSVNNPNSSVSVFDVSSDPANPALLVEIPVGLEPVSVNPRTDDEVWVVNQESDSVSIVSVSQAAITDTILVQDEPSDVVFAGTYAFISVARNNLVNVYNVDHARAGEIHSRLRRRPSPDSGKSRRFYGIRGVCSFGERDHRQSRRISRRHRRRP